MKTDIGVHMRGGVITERDSDLCTVRVRLPAGRITVEQMRGIAAIAKKYGTGIVHSTTRQAIEISHVKPENLKKVNRALEKNRTPIGSERDEIVNVIACPGTERCKFANIDTISLAQKIDEKLFGKEMPIKVRIAISGCPNACTSPMLNEIGIIGRVMPVRAEGKCTGCGTCTEYCKEGAIRIRRGTCALDETKCVQCGVCINSCPFSIILAQNRHFLITVGGRRGRHPKVGRELITAPDADSAVAAVEKIVNWVYRRAWSGRLLSDQLDEIQFGKFKDEIAGTSKSEKKEQKESK